MKTAVGCMCDNIIYTADKETLICKKLNLLFFAIIKFVINNFIKKRFAIFNRRAY